MKYNSIDLEKVRNRAITKTPFPHQSEAFEVLSKTFNYPADEYKGALLVLPTGGGKTFTSVNWICRNILGKGKKVLWLAHASSLLDQAYEAFYQNTSEIPPTRSSLNIRVASSNPTHANSGSIETTDDVLIITTQTAIANYGTNILNKKGQREISYFERFIEANKEDLFIVLDEAHHLPAYGCRNLLLGIRERAPYVYILGLTATPTYTDESRRGWLSKIFNCGIIYEAKQTQLIAQNILAIPKYIEKPTGKEFEVDDKLYNRLVKQHKDLPEYIVEKLANDSSRNDYIVNEYVQNRNEYGKTIIFADRWFQCEYLKTKLKEKGIAAEAIYSKIDGKLSSAEERNKKTATDNQNAINDFKSGKYDVLINVKMLTEGVDIPDVKSVFITRQTTSTILMTQMIGRALRGKKAGGGPDKKNANIVLFMDNWKRLINWANWDLTGGTEAQSSKTLSYPLEYISIQLIEDLSKAMDNPDIVTNTPFIKTIPVGWFQTQIVISTSEEDVEEMQSFIEFQMVYDQNKDKYFNFIDDVFDKIPKEWADEGLDEASIIPQIEKWVKKYFDEEKDDIGETLLLNLIKISIHIAQNGVKPEYHAFHEREKYDLDELAQQLMYKNYFEQQSILENMFNKQGSLWKIFYRNKNRFRAAFDAAMMKIYNRDKGFASEEVTEETDIFEVLRELSEEEKLQVFNRDGHQCLCCSIPRSRGVRLEADHILPISMRGMTAIENSQTLCSACNNRKGKNEVNFRDIHKTLLKQPKELELIPRRGKEKPEYTLRRTINFFYHCSAVSNISIHTRRNGKYYSTWEIELFQGNNTTWLKDKEQQIMNYIYSELQCPHVDKIIIK